MKYSTKLSDTVHVMVLIAINQEKSLSSASIAHARPSLSKPADQITLLDIYKAVEGDKPLLHLDTHTNPDCGVGINIQLSLQGFYNEIQNCNYFFANQKGTPLSDQIVRRTINKYADLAAINLHITPHMFRHTFATSLLEANVDIRYIQEMLGHSSINITEIYTHVAVAKQRDILLRKHPRKDFNL